jgi:hypothetical protein
MTIQRNAHQMLDALLGAGNLAAEKAKSAASDVREFDARGWWSGSLKRLAKGYGSLAERGGKVRKGITTSPPAKRAAQQTDVAKRQVKAAATSVKKAFGAGSEATKAATKSVTKPTKKAG